MISSLELARRCGVSQGTVDRALHGRPGVSEKTRARVLAAAEQFGYRPNPAVLEVMRGGSRVVGGVVPAFSSVFFLDLMQALSRRLSERGLTLLLAQADTPGAFHEIIGEFAARRACGLVAVPPAEDLRLNAEAAGMRVATLASPCGGASFLSPDERATGSAATRRLLELGHRLIAHVTYARRAHGIVAREEGYRTAMVHRRLEPLVVIEPDASALVALVRGGVTALFCHNDWLALAAIRSLGAAGIAVPGEVSVIGVDASPTFAALYPGISTMRYPFDELALAAASLIAGDEPRPPAFRCDAIPGTTVSEVRERAG
jgi:LacI family transcriptional regulator